MFFPYRCAHVPSYDIGNLFASVDPFSSAVRNRICARGLFPRLRRPAFCAHAVGINDVCTFELQFDKHCKVFCSEFYHSMMLLFRLNNLSLRSGPCICTYTYATRTPCSCTRTSLAAVKSCRMQSERVYSPKLRPLPSCLMHASSWLYLD